MDNIIFWRIFSKRSAICFFLILLLFFISVLRVGVTATADYSKTGYQGNSLRLTISKQRGTIYDCNMVPLTNSNRKIIAAVSPTPRAVTAISSILQGEELQNVLALLRNNKPVLCEVDEWIECDGIVCTYVYGQSDYIPAIHLLGYTDIDFKGVSGIQLAYDSILSSEEEIYISYDCNAKGEILEGATPHLVNNTSVEASGVVSTIDINIQSIAEEAASAIETGAVVIAEAKSGKIRASVSRPDFNMQTIEESLNNADSPLLNRAINAYNVGSVFKPCIAIAGIENNKNNFLYNCTGSFEIIDRFFRCHDLSGHGIMNLRSAIAHSCNTFFYNFAIEIGNEKIYDIASSLRFGKQLEICDNIKTAKGNLPKKEKLENLAQLANFSIGQGELLLSPISMLTLYSAIANDGAYYIPSVVEGTLKDGKFTEYQKGNKTQVMQKETADILKTHLEAVLLEGTGTTALPKTVTAAGKTATAQTGKYKNGVEICQGWFCGLFPAENPKYVVIVFSENTNRQTQTSNQIFAQIADKITELEK